jgi:DNA-binding protein H-NS
MEHQRLHTPASAIYYTFVNEPNRSWSGVGNYPGWQTGLNNLYEKLSGAR